MIGSYKTRQGRTCIVVHSTDSRVFYVRLVEPMTVENVGLATFQEQWELLESVNVAQAAVRYNNSFLSRDDRVQRHLDAIIQGTLGDTIMAKAAAATLDKDVASKAAKVAGKTAHAKAYAVPTTPAAAKAGKGEATAAAEKAPRAPREGAYGADMLITKIEPGNPKREGSASFDRFALYKTGMKVSKFLEIGGRSADIRYDVEHGLISVE